MPTTHAALEAAIEREINNASREGHVGYLDIRVTVEAGDGGADRQIIVVEAVRRPPDAPPPDADVWRIPMPSTTEASAPGQVLRQLVGDDAAGAAARAPLPLAALRSALETLAAAGPLDVDAVDVVLAPHAEVASEGAPRVRFAREPDGLWRFDGAVEIDRDFIADTSTYAHLRAWLRASLGPRCERVEVRAFDGRVAAVRVHVHGVAGGTPAAGAGN